jgi:hypothetical protein
MARYQKLGYIAKYGLECALILGDFQSWFQRLVIAEEGECFCARLVLSRLC